MTYTLAQIAEAIGQTAVGDAGLTIASVAEPATAKPEQLALASNPKYAEALAQGQARAALLWSGADWQALGLDGAILVNRPRYAMATVTRLYDSHWRAGQGVHPNAWIDPGADVASDAVIGAFCTIGAGAVIGPGAVIGAHVSIGQGVSIGNDATIRDGVRLMPGTRIGDRFVAQPGAVIGGDGFSFVTPEVSAAETVRDTLGDQGDTAAQPWERIHSLGGVTIGDDVEIGANTCIDAGTIRATSIGSGTKIDNLVQIGHNVELGQDCLICGMAGIAGSVRVGNNVILGGRTCVTDNIFVGDRVVAGFASVILSNVPAGRVMMGYPAVQMKQHVEGYKLQRRLPNLARDVAALKKAVSNQGRSD
ncbi:MAG: UDP-3-O-(3-hydroxymyristoyl)glucosamine N-acyltransferase [Pseudomonadota bacterium]